MRRGHPPEREARDPEFTGEMRDRLIGTAPVVFFVFGQLAGADVAAVLAVIGIVEVVTGRLTVLRGLRDLAGRLVLLAGALGLGIGIGANRVVHRERRAQAAGATGEAGIGDVRYDLRDVLRAAARHEVRVVDRHKDRPAAVLLDGLGEGTRRGWLAVMGSGHDPIELRDVDCGRLELCQDAGCCPGVIGTDGAPH